MQHLEGVFTGAGGLELYCQHWLPDSEPSRAVIALVHGVGEHSGRYMNLVGPLVEDGYAVYAYDHRGHGASPGARVHIDRWTEYREDLDAYLKLIARELPKTPIVIYGHSMGSLIVLDYLLSHPNGLAGAIISGVALEPAGVSKPYLITLARVLSGVVPRFYVDLGIEADALSRDPAAQQACRNDPMVTSRATVRWGTESLEAVSRIKEGMADIDLPLLVLHGEADRLNLAEGAQALYDSVPHREKTLHVYPDVCHEPHNDLGHEQVAADVKQWLGALVSPSS